MQNELYHHGVKGMKWGVRKKRPESDVDRARAAMRSARKEYNKSFNTAYNRASAAYSPFKKHREANDQRWRDAAEKAETLKNAKKDYKTAKKTAKDLKDKKFRDGLNDYYKDDLNYAADMYLYGKKGVQRISNRMNKGMSSVKASTIETGRSVATAALTTIGTYAVIGGAALAANKLRK